MGEARAGDGLVGWFERCGAAGVIGELVDLGAVEDRDEAKEGRWPFLGTRARLPPGGEGLLRRWHRRPDADRPLTPAYAVAEFQPGAKTGHAGRVGTLVGDQQLVVEAVGVKMAAGPKPAPPALGGLQGGERGLHLGALCGASGRALLVADRAASGSRGGAHRGLAAAETRARSGSSGQWRGTTRARERRRVLSQRGGPILRQRRDRVIEGETEQELFATPSWRAEAARSAARPAGARRG